VSYETSSIRCVGACGRHAASSLQQCRLAATCGWGVYRANRITPRLDDNTSVLPDSVRLLSPLNKRVYAFSNAIVGHAARVHANAGPAVKVWPDSANAPLQTLQSTRVESRPSANDNV
jgi:hypothetical protein